jgi:hypothetical protein
LHRSICLTQFLKNCFKHIFRVKRQSEWLLKAYDRFSQDFRNNPANQRLQQQIKEQTLKQQQEFDQEFKRNWNTQAPLPSQIFQFQQRPYYRGYKIAQNP